MTLRSVWTRTVWKAVVVVMSTCMSTTAVAAGATPVETDGWARLRRPVSTPPITTKPRWSDPEALLACYAVLMDVPIDLALAMGEVESTFNPKAVSNKDARGILQVLPGTAHQYRLNADRLLELEYGTYAGLFIIRDLLGKFPVEAALAGYYAGEGFYAEKYSTNTQEDITGYVRKVLVRRKKYERIAGCR